MPDRQKGAASSLLQPIDHLFDRLLSYTGISYCDALIHFNLGPLSVRRDIAALGIIHRAILGQGPAQLKEFFVLESSSLQRFTSLGKRRHGKQLRDEYEMLHRDYINRSIFGYIWIYNLLPAHLAECKTEREERKKPRLDGASAGVTASTTIFFIVLPKMEIAFEHHP